MPLNDRKKEKVDDEKRCETEGVTTELTDDTGNTAR